MINKLPIIGWFFSALAAVSVSVPFYLLWTACGLGRTYFYWLPATYQSIPFWHCVGLFIIASILHGLVPSFASVSQSVTPAKEAK